MLPPVLAKWSLAAVALALAGVAGAIASSGGGLFNPGDLRGEDSAAVRLGGVTSHAALGDRCTACHATPLSNRDMDARCVACHSDIAADLRDTTALHGRLARTSCRACHTEHRGSGANLTLTTIDHDLLGFPLRGAHATAECAGCHGVAKKLAAFKKAPTTCIGCHRRDDEHRGRFGEDCAACHSEESWSGATITHGAFPIDHGRRRGGSTGCATCHQNPADYRQYTCYGCHEHTPERVRAEHEHEGVATRLDDCVRCHARGGKHGEEGGREDHDER